MTRLGIAAFAVVLATLLVPAAVTASWLSLRVDETDAYVDTVEPLADDPVLRDELADRVAAAAVASLQDRAPVGLPGSLEEQVAATTQAVVDSPDFPEFWREANADAHREFLAIVHERGDATTDGGWVFVDLRPLVDQVVEEFAREYGVPERLVPSTELRVPVVPESKLVQARGGYRALEGLALWLPLGWAALVVLAVVVARGWSGRLRTAAVAGLGVALGSGVLLLVTDPATDLVVDQVGADHRELVRLVVGVVMSSLDDTAGLVAVGGLVAAVVLLGVSFVPVGRGRRDDIVHP